MLAVMDGICWQDTLPWYKMKKKLHPFNFWLVFEYQNVHQSVSLLSFFFCKITTFTFIKHKHLLCEPAIIAIDTLRCFDLNATLNIIFRYFEGDDDLTINLFFRWTPSSKVNVYRYFAPQRFWTGAEWCKIPHNSTRIR